MAYYCKDCSYRGRTSGQVGECPACGSFNIVREVGKGQEEKPTPAKWRLVLVSLLWGYLIMLIVWKLIQ